MGDGTKEKPLTCEDVLRLIKENGGKAEGLDLSEKVFEEGIDLSGLDLSGIILNGAHLFRANFNGSNLNRASMQGTNLQYATFNPYELRITSLQGVDFRGAHLEHAEFKEAELIADLFNGESDDSAPAYLENTDFRSANLVFADFTGCYFYGTKLEGAYIQVANIFEAHLEDAVWGSYKIGEETGEEIRKDFYSAESIYRRLKIWYTNAGIYDIAGEFFFREMTVQRKRIEWWPHPAQRKSISWWLHFRHRAWSKFVSLICGYGERPQRVITWAASWILGLAIIYFLVNQIWGWAAFLRSLYFSAVSFTALGYGGWIDKWADFTNHDWIIGLGALESFIGVFTIALFLITFTRKMRR